MTAARPLSADLIGRFAAIVGPGNSLTAADGTAFARHLTERRGTWIGETPLVLRPGSVEEVAAIVRLAAETRTAIVPQGGNTGLVGAQIPSESGAEIVVAMGRLDRIRAVDPDNDTLTVEAGVTMEAAHAAAAAADRLFPLTLGSKAECQIGGNIATNAGGTAVLAYGTMRDLVLGIEAVLPNGEVWSGLRTLRKDNAGYDLKHLFIGSEGTLGIVTAAALKLFPRPQGTALGIIAVPHPQAALALFHLARARAGFELTSFELMPRIAIEFAVRHLADASDPLPQTHRWYVLLEVSSGQSEASAVATVDTILTAGRADGLVEAGRIAVGAEAGALWRMRYAFSDVQRPEGASIKHDISVPVGRVPAFLDDALTAVRTIAPDARPVPFGHLGDGNIHFNVSQPEGGEREVFLALRPAIDAAVLAAVRAHGGSMAAEHGIGRMKRDLLPALRSPSEMALMRIIKRALDPDNIMNPGKVL